MKRTAAETTAGYRTGDPDTAALLARLESLLDELTALDPADVPDLDLLPAIEAFARATNRLDATRALWLNQSQRRRTYKAAGSERLTDWIKTTLHTDARDAAREVRRAGDVAHSLPATRDAWTRGDIGRDAVDTIAAQTRDPRVQADPDVEAAFETALVETAKTDTPTVVRQTASKLKQQLAPLTADEVAKRQHQRRGAKWSSAPDGMHRLELLTTSQGKAKVEAGLAPLMRPDPQELPAELRRTEPQRRHDALVALAEQVGPTLTDPVGRGTRPVQAILVTQLDALRGDPDAPTPVLDNGEPIPSAVARALTCDAVAALTVLDAAGTPIWGSAYRRQVPAHLRRAIQARDVACRRCSAPIAQCEVHHIVHWADGGPTSERNLLLLCWACHDDIHTGHWTIQLHDDNTVTFARPDGSTIERGPPRPPRPDQPHDAAGPCNDTPDRYEAATQT